MADIAQGSTPYIMLSMSKYDLQDALNIVLMIETQAKSLCLGMNRITVTQDGTDSLLTVLLTQEETLALSPGMADVQVRWRDAADKGHTSDIAHISIAKCLYRGVV